MKKIAIISSSVRDGRLSHRAALFLDRYIRDNKLAKSEVLDLKAYDFPLFHERFAMQPEPPAALVDFTKRFTGADGVVLVTPVYNGSFAPAVKNVIDLYNTEWRHKPVGVVSATFGSTPGIATVQQLQTILLKLGALVAPVLATVIEVGASFSEEGVPADPEKAAHMVGPMVDELLWLIEKSAQ